MQGKNDKLESEISWEALRRRASALNIPAWMLAEDLAFHEAVDKLILKERVNG